MLNKLLILALSVFAAGCSIFQSASIFNHTFATDPTGKGWELLNFDEAATGEWVADEMFALRISTGAWQSPVFDSKPHQYYRLTFRSRAEGMAYWAVQFFDSQGQLLMTDNYCGIDASEDWIDNEFYFQGKADAATAHIWFRPKRGKMLEIRNVALAKAGTRHVLDWTDRLYAQMPAVGYEPSADRWRHIPRTMQKLQSGEKTRILILGDSIGNDTGNSPVDKLIQRKHPKSKVEVITSVRSATGCAYYQHDNRVEQFVLRYEPDLVMIIAISHGRNLEAIRSVIRQIKTNSNIEVVLTSGAVSRERIEERNAEFFKAMADLAEEEQAEFLHLRAAWNEYSESIEPLHGDMWLMRDRIHANVRGKQVLARILEKYFAPESD